MTGAPLVSVIIPTWNRARSVERAVRSALGQTIPPSEILVCDDGSTDGTRDIVESIGDGRVGWLPGGHSGHPAVPRNRGVAAARGEWLAFLDSDDEWLPEKLEKQLRLAEAAGIGAVCTNARRVVPDHGETGDYIRWGSDRFTFRDFLVGNRVICSSALVRRSIIQDAGGFPETPSLKTGQDYGLWLRVSTMTEFAFLDEPLLLYHDDPAGSVRSGWPGYWPQKERALRDFLKWGMRKGISWRLLARACGKYAVARVLSI